MSSEVAISVQQLSKCYHVYEKPQDRLKQAILPRLRRSVGLTHHNYFREFWAVRDVSFEIMRGETAGILGRNGSGKSTLLQMICGTLTPTSGTVQTNGRIAALLELGSGFNPEFSGRENIFLNGTILGMSQAEIEQRFDDIAAFADIGDHLEQPVKTYSSGMYVRLAFAVNIMSQPQIMVVDEALAVGDMNFQAKCMTALSRIQDSGATILFVSHDIGSIRSLCSKAVYLERGELKQLGSASVVAQDYVRNMRQELSNEARRFAKTTVDQTVSEVHAQASSESSLENAHCDFKSSEEFARRVSLHRYGSGGARITFVEMINSSKEASQFFEFNEQIFIRIHFISIADMQVAVNFAILDDKKINLVGGTFAACQQPLLTVKDNERYVVEYELRLPLFEGNYSLRTQITTPIVSGETSDVIDLIEDAVVFQVGRWERARIWSKVHLFPKLQITRTSPHTSTDTIN